MSSVIGHALGAILIAVICWWAVSWRKGPARPEGDEKVD